MNKETQAAWLAYMQSQTGNPKFLIAKDFDSGIVQDIEKPVRDGFDAGFLAGRATLEVERDQLVRQVSAMTVALKQIQDMAYEELSRHGMLPMSFVSQIEADARAALAAQEREARG